MAVTKNKLHSKLAKFTKALEKRTNIKGIIVQPTFKMDCINSGSSVINMLIGGTRLSDGSFVCPGYPKGTIIEIYGRESSGKSTIALTAMGQAIFNGGRNDGCGIYVDLECAVKDHYAMRLGCDFRSIEQGGTGQAIRLQPHSAEETETAVMDACLQGVDMVVIDSVAGLVSERELQRNVSNPKEKQGVGEIPRFMSNWMPKLQAVIARTGTTVIFLNQTRDKIGQIGFAEETLKSTTGGHALKFWASIRMMLQPKKSTKAKRYNPIIKEKEDVQIASDILIKMIKNKVDAKQGHSGLITIRYGVGIDELRTMMNVAEAYGVIKKSKNNKKQEVFSFASPSTGEVIEEIGIEKFRISLKRNEEMLKELLAASTEHIMSGYKMIEDDELAELAEGAITKTEGIDEDYEVGDQPKVEFDEQTSPDEDDDVDLKEEAGKASGLIDLEMGDD